MSSHGGRIYFKASPLAICYKLKESLIYVDDHVASEAIDDDIQGLIEKYRRQLKKEILQTF